ncbi:MAG: DUF7146 domain-containing protein, partial [Paracoccaceae bacterium]
YCFKSRCSFADIAQAANLPASGAQIDNAAKKEAKRKQVEYAASKLAQARSLWDAAKPIAGTKAEAYLRGRGITAPLPDSLRFMPDIYHAPSSTWACAMVADVQSTGGVHRTFFTKRGQRLSKSAKLMLGPCAGGAVRLSSGAGPLVVAEGIETALSLLSGLLSGPASVWAALSTSGMRALHLPPDPAKLIIATDSDDKEHAGKLAGNVLANRAHTLGWDVSLMPAPEGKDWNDVLQARECVA